MPVPNIRNRKPDESMFVTWDADDKIGRQKAIARAGQAFHNVNNVVYKERSLASNTYLNIQPNTSVRDSFSRRDYDYFRPDEMSPRNQRHMVAACMNAYESVDIVHNIIDLMSDFAVKGISLVHPNPRIEQIHREWAKKIGLKERSERFVSTLLRAGTVLVKRDVAKLKISDLDNLRQGLASGDLIEPDEPPIIKKNEAPWGYTFIHPLLVEVLGGEELAQFTGMALYGITVPHKVAGIVKNPKSSEEQFLVNQLPEYIINPIRNGKSIIPLDPKKLITAFYKKDDWQLWGNPLVKSILDNIITYNKMKLADLTALDGAISHVRLWKLGDLERRILPTPAAVARLADILVNNVAAGAMDLIWGPELDFKETSTDVHKFLGSEKYGPCLAAIFNGLGIPTTLQSGSGRVHGSNMNNYLSLKVLTERLIYIRERLVEFWEYELRLFQKALGYRIPASLKFDFMVLTDEEAYKKLLLELADRDIISVQTLLEHFGEIPEVEAIRIKREHQAREKGNMKKKAGPYHNAEADLDLLKIFATTGLVTPSEAGVELDEKDPGQKNLQEWKIKAAAQAKPLGISNNPLLKSTTPSAGPNGRPKGVKDSAPRAQKTLRPKTVANFLHIRAWAKDMQQSISEHINPIYLASLGKDTMRSLTDEESNQVEDFKYALLCNMQPFSQLTDEYVNAVISGEVGQLTMPPIVTQIMEQTIAKFSDKIKRVPTLEENRLFRAEVCALYRCD